VYSIREAATTNLQKLAQEFGPEWAKEHLVQQVLEMINNPHYLYRMTILVAIAALAPVVSHDVLCSHMLPVVVSCAKDQVWILPFDTCVVKGLPRLYIYEATPWQIKLCFPNGKPPDDLRISLHART
jgi:serine/threonine-protein phosphatase 2A regulatory subunit A